MKQTWNNISKGMIDEVYRLLLSLKRKMGKVCSRLSSGFWWKCSSAIPNLVSWTSEDSLTGFYDVCEVYVLV